MLCLRNEGNCGIRPLANCFLVDGCCYFRVGPEWLLFFPDTASHLYIAHSHVARRKPSLQPASGAHILAHSILPIEGNIWYEGASKFVHISFVLIHFFPLMIVQQQRGPIPSLPPQIFASSHLTAS